MNALRSLAGDKITLGSGSVGVDGAIEGVHTGGDINSKASTLKTVNVSSVLKVSNVFDRDGELTPELYEDLFEDMEE